LLGAVRAAEKAPPDHTLCRLALRLVPSDESLARVVGVLVRKRWSILELHHRRGDAHDAVQLIAVKPDGRPDHLVAALEREITVISVER